MIPIYALEPKPVSILTIEVTSGAGSGPTTLAAFDAALQDAGIADFNLIPLSSVIPRGSEVRTSGIRTVDRLPRTPRWGDRLYVVLAAAPVEKPNEEAWAGLGWVQVAATGEGLFAEHHGASEHQVAADIHATLTDMTQRRSSVDFGPVQSVIRGIVCDTRPVCSLVAASYMSAGWNLADQIDLR